MVAESSLLGNVTHLRVLECVLRHRRRRRHLAQKSAVAGTKKVARLNRNFFIGFVVEPVLPRAIFIDASVSGLSITSFHGK